MNNINNKIVSVVTVAFLNACYLNETPNANTSIPELEGKSLTTLSQEYDIQSEKARAEFFSKLPSGYSKKTLYPKALLDTLTAPVGFQQGDSIAWNSVENDTLDYLPELNPDSMGVREKIMQLAWEASYSGNVTAFREYLISQGLEAQYNEIAAKYGLEEYAKALSKVKPKGVSLGQLQRRDLFQDGDIFLKYDQSSSYSSGSNNSSGGSSGSNILGWLIPGKWGHAAFYDSRKRLENSQNFLLSASNSTDQANNGALGRVGYDKLDGYWAAATEVTVQRVAYASASQRTAAIDYSKQFIGKPFTFTTTRESNSEFYCSKTVYRGWKSQGFELEPHTNDFIGGPWISYPSGVDWRYKKVWRVKIWYPVVLWSEMPDFYITPSNLIGTNKTIKVIDL